MQQQQQQQQQQHPHPRPHSSSTNASHASQQPLLLNPFPKQTSASVLVLDNSSNQKAKSQGSSPSSSVFASKTSPFIPRSEAVLQQASDLHGRFKLAHEEVVQFVQDKWLPTVGLDGQLTRQLAQQTKQLVFRLKDFLAFVLNEPAPPKTPVDLVTQVVIDIGQFVSCVFHRHLYEEQHPRIREQQEQQEQHQSSSSSTNIAGMPRKSLADIASVAERATFLNYLDSLYQRANIMFLEFQAPVSNSPSSSSAARAAAAAANASQKPLPKTPLKQYSLSLSSLPSPSITSSSLFPSSNTSSISSSTTSLSSNKISNPSTSLGSIQSSISTKGSSSAESISSSPSRVLAAKNYIETSSSPSLPTSKPVSSSSMPAFTSHTNRPKPVSLRQHQLFESAKGIWSQNPNEDTSPASYLRGLQDHTPSPSTEIQHSLSSNPNYFIGNDKRQGSQKNLDLQRDLPPLPPLSHAHPSDIVASNVSHSKFDQLDQKQQQQQNKAYLFQSVNNTQQNNSLSSTSNNHTVQQLREKLMMSSSNNSSNNNNNDNNNNNSNNNIQKNASALPSQKPLLSAMAKGEAHPPHHVQFQIRSEEESSAKPPIYHPKPTNHSATSSSSSSSSATAPSKPASQNYRKHDGESYFSPAIPVDNKPKKPLSSSSSKPSPATQSPQTKKQTQAMSYEQTLQQQQNTIKEEQTTASITEQKQKQNDFKKSYRMSEMSLLVNSFIDSYGDDRDGSEVKNSPNSKAVNNSDGGTSPSWDPMMAAASDMTESKYENSSNDSSPTTMAESLNTISTISLSLSDEHNVLKTPISFQMTSTLAETDLMEILAAHPRRNTEPHARPANLPRKSISQQQPLHHHPSQTFPQQSHKNHHPSNLHAQEQSGSSASSSFLQSLATPHPNQSVSALLNALTVLVSSSETPVINNSEISLQDENRGKISSPLHNSDKNTIVVGGSAKGTISSPPSSIEALHQQAHSQTQVSSHGQGYGARHGHANSGIETLRSVCPHSLFSVELDLITRLTSRKEDLQCMHCKRRLKRNAMRCILCGTMCHSEDPCFPAIADPYQHQQQSLRRSKSANLSSSSSSPSSRSISSMHSSNYTHSIVSGDEPDAVSSGILISNAAAMAPGLPSNINSPASQRRIKAERSLPSESEIRSPSSASALSVNANGPAAASTVTSPVVASDGMEIIIFR